MDEWMDGRMDGWMDDWMKFIRMNMLSRMNMFGRIIVLRTDVQVWMNMFRMV